MQNQYNQVVNELQRYKNYVENLQQPKKRYEPEDHGPEESEESDNYITEICKQKRKPVKKTKVL